MESFMTESVEGPGDPKHAPKSPSNKRWPNCPGSPREEEQYEDIPGEAAIDGTGSHLLLELCFQNNVVAAHYDGQIIGVNHHDQPNGWMVHIDRIERVQMALDYVTRRVGELKEQFPGAEVIVESESRSNPGVAFGRDDWWGTCDITITVIRDAICLFLEVADYKDGRMWVSEKDNSQNTSYLFGKMVKFIGSGPDKVRPFRPENVSNCRQTIIQPKTTPPIRYDDDTTPQGVVTAAERLSAAASLCDQPNAPLIPGEHCQWCKANPKSDGHCTAASDKSLEVLEALGPMDVTHADDTKPSLFEYIGKAISDVSSLDAETLVQIADARAALGAAFDKVDVEIERRILADAGSVPGYAMQPGKGSQVWAQDEKAIVKMLKGRQTIDGKRLKQGDVYPAKLISPAAVLALKSLKPEQKERIQKDFISKLAGKLKLTRVAYEKPSAEMMFASVSQCDTDAPSAETEPQSVSFME